MSDRDVILTDCRNALMLLAQHGRWSAIDNDLNLCIYSADVLTIALTSHASGVPASPTNAIPLRFHRRRDDPSWRLEIFAAKRVMTLEGAADHISVVHYAIGGWERELSMAAASRLRLALAA